jgi:GT2 family glycosyltransferase
LRSISGLGGFDRCNLLVVDNNSADGSAGRLEQAAAKFTNIAILASPTNRGYFGGAKWALNQYLARHPLPDWVIVCNNDIILDDRDFLRMLLERDPRNEGVLAPAVISSLTGHDSNPMITTKPGRIRLMRYRFLLSTYSIARLTQRIAPLARKLRYSIPGGRSGRCDRRQIYAPHGSLIIFSRRYFETGGTIDDGSFLFAEEFSVAETCRRLDLPVVHDPSLRVRHNDSQTTGRRLTRDMYQFQKQGLQYAIRTYLGTPCASVNTDAATNNLT